MDGAVYKLFHNEKYGITELKNELKNVRALNHVKRSGLQDTDLLNIIHYAMAYNEPINITQAYFRGCNRKDLFGIIKVILTSDDYITRINKKISKKS